MKILGIDLETTGLLPQEDRIIEVGAVLYDWDTQTPLRLFSQFINPERLISEEIMVLTGISNPMIEQYAHPEDVIMRQLLKLIAEADYVMTHNGTDFDKLFFDASMARIGSSAPDRLWLDSRIDIVFPDSITTRNLRFLACEHGFINPFAHRAIFDVLTMFKVARKYPLESIVARAKEPTIYVQALVSFDDKEKAKTRGYYWCGPKKIWWRSMKTSDYEIEQVECGFKTAVIEKPE